MRVGEVVKVRSCGKLVDAFVIRTYTDGDFRAIPMFTALAFEVVTLHKAGNMDALKELRPQIESHSEVYSEAF